MVGKLGHYLELMRRMMDQSECRVLWCKKVPAAEKVGSIFEEHIDIIQKGSHEMTFGHKVSFNGGNSLLILDCWVVKGNPADQDQMETGASNDTSSFTGAIRTGPCLTEDSPLRTTSSGLKEGDRRRHFCQEGQVKGFRYGRFQLGLSAVKAVSGWNRRVHLHAQTGLCCLVLYLEELAAFQQYVHLSVVSFNLLILTPNCCCQHGGAATMT